MPTGRYLVDEDEMKKAAPIIAAGLFGLPLLYFMLRLANGGGGDIRDFSMERAVEKATQGLSERYKPLQRKVANVFELAGLNDAGQKNTVPRVSVIEEAPGSVTIKVETPSLVVN